MALVTQSEAARLLKVSRRSLDRKKELLEAMSQAQRVGARLLYETDGLREAFNSITDLQVGNADRIEAEAMRQVEQDAEEGKIPPYAQSKARREHYLALLAQRQLERLEGTLVDVAAVKSMFFEEHRRARNQLQIMPARIAAELHAQKDSGAVCLVLEREIHRTLVGAVRRHDGEAGSDGRRRQWLTMPST